MLNNLFCCIVVGSRDYKNYEEFSQNLYLAMKELNVQSLPVFIVSGGARGADSMAKKYAIENNLRYKEFPANWNLYGNSAGPIRNLEMHRFAMTFKNRACVAFWDGKTKKSGTFSNFKMAQDSKTPLKIFEIRKNGFV